MSTRAVHINILSSFDTDGFFMALRWFIARMGKSFKCLWIKKPILKEVTRNHKRHLQPFNWRCRHSVHPSRSTGNSFCQMLHLAVD